MRDPPPDCLQMPQMTVFDKTPLPSNPILYMNKGYAMVTERKGSRDELELPV